MESGEEERIQEVEIVMEEFGSLETTLKGVAGRNCWRESKP